MSLDIYLKSSVTCEHCGKETGGGEEMCDLNVTHNLTDIAIAVNIYPFLWRAPEFGIDKAWQLIKPLEYAIARMVEMPDRFRPLEPSNGWGTLSGFIDFCKKLLEAAKEHPNASVHTCR